MVKGEKGSRSKSAQQKYPYRNSLLDLWTREESLPRLSQHVGLNHHRPWKHAERKQLGQESSDLPRRSARIWHQLQHPHRQQRRDRRVPPQQTRSRSISSAEAKEVNPKVARLWKTRHTSRGQCRKQPRKRQQHSISVLGHWTTMTANQSKYAVRDKYSMLFNLPEHRPIFAFGRIHKMNTTRRPRI